mmetsp:Transcript_10488/g.25395  ORF Transcript_10488/g.25395 Transcript_10488/m.25395 type:complete len:252 (+) Transcript_10488:745-1500(+)
MRCCICWTRIGGPSGRPTCRPWDWCSGLTPTPHHLSRRSPCRGQLSCKRPSHGASSLVYLRCVCLSGGMRLRRSCSRTTPQTLPHHPRQHPCSSPPGSTKGLGNPTVYRPAPPLPHPLPCRRTPDCVRCATSQGKTRGVRVGGRRRAFGRVGIWVFLCADAGVCVEWLRVLLSVPEQLPQATRMLPVDRHQDERAGDAQTVRVAGQRACLYWPCGWTRALYIDRQTDRETDMCHHVRQTNRRKLFVYTVIV